MWVITRREEERERSSAGFKDARLLDLGWFGYVASFRPRIFR